MGPGTNIIAKVLAKTKPYNRTDSVAREHDIDYLTNTEPIISDVKAIANSLSHPDSGTLPMLIGLSARSILDMMMHPISSLSEDNITHMNTPIYPELVELLHSIVEN
jgi:hypothetical protein